MTNIIIRTSDTLLARLRSDGAKACHSPRGAAHAALPTSFYYRNGDSVTFIIFNRPFSYILPNYRMVNYDSIFNLSSGVTCNWCIQLGARQSVALMALGTVPRNKRIINV